MMTDLPIGCPHISTEHNRREQKGLVMIKHPVTKNSAKEEPQNLIKKTIFQTFKNLFYNSVLLKYLMLLCCSNVLQ